MKGACICFLCKVHNKDIWQDPNTAIDLDTGRLQAEYSSVACSRLRLSGNSGSGCVQIVQKARQVEVEQAYVHTRRAGVLEVVRHQAFGSGLH